MDYLYPVSIDFTSNHKLMKLHLPKRLFAAILAAFAVCTSTTIGADIISVNFGSQSVAGTSGEVGGVSAAYWVNITGSEDGTTSLTANNDSGTTVGSLYLDVAQDPWAGGGTDVSTVLGAMQKSYLDLSSNNAWTIDLNAYMVSDVTLYFSGDGGTYAPVSVNGTSYVGGQDAEGVEDWGTRTPDTNGTLGDHNTISVTGVKGLVLATNVPQNDAYKRATISGMQVTDAVAYSAALASGDNTVSTLSFTKADGSELSLSGIEEAERYVAVEGDADNTSRLALDTAVKGLQVSANKVTLTSYAGGSDMLWALSGATLDVATSLGTNADVQVGGAGTITISQDQVLNNLSIYGHLHVADNVTIEVTGQFLEWEGCLITGGTGAGLYGSSNAAEVEKVTTGGVSLNIDKAWKEDYLGGGVAVGENATASVSFDGTGEVKFLKTASASGEVTVTLNSLNVGTTAGEQSISAGTGANVVGAFDGQLKLENSQVFTVGKGVSLSYKQAEDSSGGRAIVLGHGSLVIDGGSVVAESICLADGGYNKRSNLTITNGGYLGITTADNDNGKWGGICLSHWMGSAVNVLIEDGEFRALDGKVSVVHDGNSVSHLTIGRDGAMNVKGLRMGTQANVMVVGKLNLGSVGVENHSGSFVVDGGTLGALESSWSSQQAISFRDGSTIQLAVYDVDNKTYSGSADITLSGLLSGDGGSLTLAGNGALTVSRYLEMVVGVAEGAGATAKFDGTLDTTLPWATSGTFTGYGNSTTDGYATMQGYSVFAAGSTVSALTHGETTYQLQDGKVLTEITGDQVGKVFGVNTVVNLTDDYAEMSDTTVLVA